MKKILIIGAGVSGKGCAQLLKISGKSFEIVDDALGQPPEEATSFFQNFEFAIVSPGIGPESFWLNSAKSSGLKLVGEAQFVLPKLSSLGVQLLGVTGTNGKTSVTLFCEFALKKRGLCASACGNVGYSLGAYACDLLKKLQTGSDPVKEEDHIGIFSKHIAVIELSSYQLENLEGAYFDGGVILNLSRDHLDRHKTMENYALAKGRLTFCMKKGKAAYVSKGYAKHYPKALFSSAVVLDPKNVKLELLSNYEAENLTFAHALLKPYGFSFDELIDLYAEFPRPKHRRSFVCEIGGVRYINDSKATNLSAVKAAFDAEKGPIWLITSGQMKRESFKDLDIDYRRLVGVIAFGESQDDAFSAFHTRCPVLRAESLADAVRLAKESADPGQTVLFSPGGASFDLFENYIDRGEQFEYTVSRSLLPEGASHE